MRLVVLTVLAGLAGCAHEPTYQRIDGAAIDPHALKTAMTICRGEDEKAQLTAPQGIRLLNDDVLNGCMAQQGYEARPN